MAGNPSFDLLVAFMTEKQLKKTWQSIWTTEWPLLQKIKSDELNYNTAMENPTGNSILLPVNYLGPATSARVGTRANSFTPITPNGTQGFTQAQYFYAQYENAFYLNSAEKTQIQAGAATTRIPILPGKVQQLQDDFKNIVTTDLHGTQGGTGYEGNGQLTGQQYFLSTSNSPGGISQTTYSNWAATVRTSAGAFYEGLVDREIARIKNLGRGPADFCELSYTDTNDVYTKFYSLIAPSQILTDPARVAKYGFEFFIYRGLDCFQDGKLGTALAGSMIVGRSSSWYVNCKSELPQMATRDGQIRLPGTNSDEYMYEWWFTTGTDDCAGNTLVSGIV